MFQRAIVVGASSGIGAEVVVELVRSGYRVAAIARRSEALDEVCARANALAGPGEAFSVVHDVRDTASVGAVFDEVVRRLDGLDLLVYSSGVMPAIGEDQLDPAVDREIVEVNLIGAMAWLDVAGAHLRVQGRGTLVGIGSVAGDRGRRGNPAYCASKAGLHTFLESLRNRLARHGVRVLTVKPGPVDTPMTAGRDGLPFLIDAPTAARRIVGAIGGDGTVYVPAVWRPIMAIVASIPSVVFRRMNF